MVTESERLRRRVVLSAVLVMMSVAAVPGGDKHRYNFGRRGLGEFMRCQHGRDAVIADLNGKCMPHELALTNF